MSKSSKKILITGVAGFLGSHLADKLIEMGHKIVGVDNMLCGYKDNIPKSIDFHKIDCCNLKEMNEAKKGVDVVYHTAAKARVQPSIEDPLTNYNVNVYGNLRTMNYLKKKQDYLFKKISDYSPIIKSNIIKSRFSLGKLYEKVVFKTIEIFRKVMHE